MSSIPNGFSARLWENLQFRESESDVSELSRRSPLLGYAQCSLTYAQFIQARSLTSKNNLTY